MVFRGNMAVPQKGFIFMKAVISRTWQINKKVGDLTLIDKNILN